MGGLQTEFDFTLPKGFVDDVGVLHRDGVMRLATARDEIEPLRNRDLDGPDDPYLTILVLARVVTELGTLEQITPDVVERLFAADLAFLQDLYGIINFGDADDVAALQATVAPATPVRDEPADDAVVDESDAAADNEPPAMTTSTSPRTRGYVEEVQPSSS